MPSACPTPTAQSTRLKCFDYSQTHSLVSLPADHCTRCRNLYTTSSPLSHRCRSSTLLRVCVLLEMIMQMHSFCTDAIGTGRVRQRIGLHLRHIEPYEILSDSQALYVRWCLHEITLQHCKCRTCKTPSTMHLALAVSSCPISVT